MGSERAKQVREDNLNSLHARAATCIETNVIYALARKASAQCSCGRPRQRLAPMPGIMKPPLRRQLRAAGRSLWVRWPDGAGAAGAFTAPGGGDLSACRGHRRAGRRPRGTGWRAGAISTARRCDRLACRLSGAGQRRHANVRARHYLQNGRPMHATGQRSTRRSISSKPSSKASCGPRGRFGPCERRQRSIN